MIIKECFRHGLVEHAPTKHRPGGVCKKCRVMYVTEKRKRVKLRLVEYKGGRCEVCSYDTCPQALELHHRDPSQKDPKIVGGNSVSWARKTAEADKCALLCANCHREVHAGIIQVEDGDQRRE